MVQPVVSIIQPVVSLFGNPQNRFHLLWFPLFGNLWVHIFYGFLYSGIPLRFILQPVVSFPQEPKTSYLTPRPQIMRCWAPGVCSGISKTGSTPGLDVIPDPSRPHRGPIASSQELGTVAGQLDLLPRVKHSVAPVARRLRLRGHGSKKCKNIYPATAGFSLCFSFTRFPLKSQFLTHGHVCDAPLQNPRSPRSEYLRPYRAQRPSFLGSWVPVLFGVSRCDFYAEHK